MKCAVILSLKSSGSSALQQRLVGLPGVRHVDHTHHKRFETLYWTKAASVLQMDQIQLPKSEVPLKSSKAKVDLIQLLKENLGDYHPPEKDVDLKVRRAQCPVATKTVISDTEDISFK